MRPSYVITRDAITVNANGRVLRVDKKDHVKHQALENSLKLIDDPSVSDEEANDIVMSYFDRATRIVAYTNGDFAVDANGDLFLAKEGLTVEEIQKYIDDNRPDLAYEEKPVHKLVSEHLQDFCKRNLPYKRLIALWKNIRQNPSESSVQQLYGFLTNNDHPITPDGCFIAYKRVNRVDEGKLVDNKTKSIDNSPGAIVSMPRENVDPDPNQTCSHGLHVASFEYAQSYAGDTLIMVKVNPRDVVAVPIDYNQQKMRTCRYEVIGLCEAKIKERTVGEDAYESPTDEVPDDEYLDDDDIPDIDDEDFDENDNGKNVEITSDPVAAMSFNMMTEEGEKKVTIAMTNIGDLMQKAARMLRLKGYNVKEP